MLITIGVTAAMVAAMLLVRRGAPEGSRFQDGDRASGVFGVLSTGFALLLGFVVFLAFTKYDDSRSGAETEALVLVQQFETARLMPPEVSPRLSGELICYGRSVVEQEWPAMGSGSETDSINPWGIAMFRTLESVEPRAASEQSAFDAWLSQTGAREEARRDRLHAAEGIVPLPVWLVLFFSAALIFVYLLFFADSGESAVVQGMMAGSVTAVVVATLLVLGALNRPYQPDIGGLRPVAMQRSLAIIDEARATLAIDDPLPCDETGDPT
ncbi:MAG TPA: hypothetical protein VFI59_08240 [Actinomycetota bacterium]|nr:hypothetical protein [Actinomycetota bacterium]